MSWIVVVAFASAILFVTNCAACKPNGQKLAVGAFRLYFGENDERNICVGPLLPCVPPWTNNRVHLMAVIAAMRNAQDGVPLKIMTTSEYTVGFLVY